MALRARKLMWKRRDKMKGKIFYGATLALSVACLGLVALIWRTPELLSFMLIVNALALIAIGRSFKHGLLLFVLSGLLGAAAEAFAVGFGPWAYAFPEIFGVPFWLILVWGTSGVFLARMSGWIREWLKI